MHRQRFRIAIGILVCTLVQIHGADKDENRPYEFGFEVEVEGQKQQHRHEEKDKDGIIMGEFGFITADDVYHVTVYATDKDGKFRILSMKNIHLKSSSKSAAAQTSNPRQGHSLGAPKTPATPNALALSTNPPAAQPVAPNIASRFGSGGETVPNQKTVPQINGPPQSNIPPQISTQTQSQSPTQGPLQPSNIRSCSSCSIPTTTTRAPPINNILPNSTPNSPNNIAGPGNRGNTNPNSPPAIQSSYPLQGTLPIPGTQPNTQLPLKPYNEGVPPVQDRSIPYPQQPYQQINPSPSYNGGPESNSQLPEEPSQLSYPTQGFSRPNGGQQAVNGIQPPKVFTNVAQPDVSANKDNANQVGQKYPDIPSPPRSTYSDGGSVAREPKQYSGPKPKLVSVNMQVVDKNTDVQALRPGEKRGLPDGLNEDDMSRLLYIFNYTVGFHGHYEEGYENGVKKGYYYVTGRNGVRTRIDYVADGTGFHPKVSQEVLDLLSEDVPKPETEKDPKYGLKSYEFKWLYFPVGSEKY